MNFHEIHRIATRRSIGSGEQATQAMRDLLADRINAQQQALFDAIAFGPNSGIIQVGYNPEENPNPATCTNESEPSTLSTESLQRAIEEFREQRDLGEQRLPGRLVEEGRQPSGFTFPFIEMPEGREHSWWQAMVYGGVLILADGVNRPVAERISGRQLSRCRKRKCIPSEYFRIGAKLHGVVLDRAAMNYEVDADGVWSFNPKRFTSSEKDVVEKMPKLLGDVQKSAGYFVRTRGHCSVISIKDNDPGALGLSSPQQIKEEFDNQLSIKALRKHHQKKLKEIERFKQAVVTYRTRKDLMQRLTNVLHKKAGGLRFTGRYAKKKVGRDASGGLGVLSYYMTPSSLVERRPDYQCIVPPIETEVMTTEVLDRIIEWYEGRRVVRADRNEEAVELEHNHPPHPALCGPSDRAPERVRPRPAHFRRQFIRRGRR